MALEDDLVSCFEDTISMVCNDERLLKKTQSAVLGTKVYKENSASEISLCRRGLKTEDNTNGNGKTIHQRKISVVSGTTFAMAKDFAGEGKIGVLNFANPHCPGGGVQNGAMAQEECLCRSSNLYPCLLTVEADRDYYTYNKENTNCFFSDRIIYTDNVTVFKTDDTVPVVMPENEWFNVSVITCAAPYAAERKYTNKAALKELFKNRIKNIFSVAIENDVEILILGAFGCGAFKNPPKVVAKAFHEVIAENKYEKAFSKIAFAIKSTVNDDPFEVCPNIAAFEREFYGISSELSKERVSGRTLYAFNNAVMPSGIIRKAGKEFLAYDKWKNKNKYFGKQFSILGDSISTLEGYNPGGYKYFYISENIDKSEVHNMEDTWWGKVIDFFGAELLVNNSWSGSRVTRLPDQDNAFPSGCSDERTSGLNINSVKPDVVLINLGINDWANGVPLVSNETRVIGPTCDSCFSDAYEIMIDKLQANYPEAELWCCTLNTTYMSSNSSFQFPHSYGGRHIEEYNKIIKFIAAEYDCKVIDLYNYHMPYDSIDGTHPNADGMNTLATMIIRSMADKTGKAFI